jgi:acrylyl-CoA reductase (NADPH)
VVDTVGSHTLANACASTKYGGVVTACGLAQGMDFPSSVAPFILRGVTLAGIDSVMAPRAVREAAWARLAQDLDTAQLERMTREVGLADAIGLGAEILAGQVRGRVVVNVNAHLPNKSVSFCHASSNQPERSTSACATSRV